MDNNIEKKAVRNSSFELLKLIAMLFIIFSHSMPDGDSSMPSSYIDLDNLPTNIQLLGAYVLKNNGQLGNIMFLFVSGWFLQNSKSVNWKKIAHLFGDSLFVSVFMFTMLELIGYDFGLKAAVKAFFPVTFQGCWYVTCYLILYAIHPILNAGIEILSKEQLLIFNFVFFVLYNCIGFIMQNTYFFYSDIVGFVGLYFYVAYIKRYLSKTTKSKSFNINLIVGGFLLHGILLITTGILAKKGIAFEGQMLRWETYMNPFFIAIGLGMFNIARTKEFYSKTINYISSLSILIYMIHANILIRLQVRFDLFAFIKDRFGYDHLLLWIVLYTVINYLGSLVIAIIYDKTLRKYIFRLYEYLALVIAKLFNKTIGKLLLID